MMDTKKLTFEDLTKEIASISINNRQNKEKTMEHIKALMETDLTNDNASLFAHLYAHFIPKPNGGSRKTHGNDFLWLKQALTKDNDHLVYNLRYIMVIDGKAYCTDGRRIHIIETDKEEGFYDKDFNKVHGIEKNEYPNVLEFTGLFDLNSSIFKINDFEMNKAKVDLGQVHIHNRIVNIPFGEGDEITFDYDLLCQAIGQRKASIEIIDKESVIRIRTGGREVYLMPVC